jgi:two-component system, sensor histidine kinase
MNSRIPILVVDDRPECLTVIGSVLDSSDYELVMVQSGQAALRALLHTDFAAALLDVKMPDMSGYELARVIHARKSRRRLPIIFVSGHFADAKDMQLAYEVGGVDYVTKPFDPHVLRAKVRLFAELYRQRIAHAAEGVRLRDDSGRPRLRAAKAGNAGYHELHSAPNP